MWDGIVKWGESAWAAEIRHLEVLKEAEQKAIGCNDIIWPAAHGVEAARLHVFLGLMCEKEACVGLQVLSQLPKVRLVTLCF